MAEREIVLLSGMHRSGTSALARVFNLLGATLPEPLVPASLGNELGHWEPAEAVAMNDAALLAAGSDVNSLHPLSPEWVEGGGAEAFTEEVRVWLARVAPEGARTVVKDPRIALLAPFWRSAVERLGARPRFVVSWRDPWEVSRSLSSRQLEHFPDEVWPHARVELLWLKHQLELERASRGAPRSFVAYESLLDDWTPVMTRVVTELELKPLVIEPEARLAIEAFLKPNARRQRRPVSAAPSDATAGVLKLLEARVGAPEGGSQAFDRAAARLDGATRLLGGYLGALEARAAADVARGSDVGDARALTAALYEAARTAELETVESAKRAVEAEPAPCETDLADLRSRHEGLRAAHDRVVADLRTARRELQEAGQRFETRLEALQESFRGDLVNLRRKGEARIREIERAEPPGLADAERRLADAEREHEERLADAEVRLAEAERRLADAEREHQERLAEADVRLADAERRLADAEGEHEQRLAAAEHDRLQSVAEAKRRLRDQTARAELAGSELTRAQDTIARLRDEAARLGAEVGDHRDAYEALREEAAGERAAAASARDDHARRLAALHAEHAALQIALAASDARNQQSAARGEALAAERDRTAAAAAALRTERDALRAETVALRASASWRATRPVRSVTFRLRRLVRR